MNLWRFLPLFILSSLATNTAFSAVLSLETYLSQVEGKNENLVSAKKTSEGSEFASREADLMYAPVLFAQTQWSDNKFRNSTFPSAYRSFFADNYSVGIRELTPYGVNFSLSYLLSHQGFLGTLDQSTFQVVDRKFWEGTPKAEVTFSLLRNWLGSETKATEEISRAGSLMNQYGSRFRVKTTRAEAQAAYVRVVSAQQLVHLYKDSLASASDIFSWNRKRMKANLGEETDVLQAQATVESSTLLLQSSEDDLRSAIRDFNRLRNLDSDLVDEVLVLPSIQNAIPPVRTGLRDDTRAAQENAKLSAAQAKLGLERNRPVLEAFGSFALNDRESEIGDTFNRSFRLGQQTTAFGLRFNMPLNFGLLSDTARGYAMMEEGSEMLVSQKIFEQDVEWKDLVQKLAEAKHRFEIATTLAKIQKQKVENERVRLKRGRTTTYQTLIFNIDYDSAQAAKIQAQGTILSILARMQTFGDDHL